MLIKKKNYTDKEILSLFIMIPSNLIQLHKLSNIDIFLLKIYLKKELSENPMNLSCLIDTINNPQILRMISVSLISYNQRFANIKPKETH